MKKNIMMVAGSSGGHLFPAIAMTQFLIEEGYNVSLLTDTRAARFLKGYENLFSTFLVVPYMRVKNPLTLWRTCKIIHDYIKKNTPSLMFGWGGITTVLPCFLAWFYGIPYTIHQSDAVMGRANKLLSYGAHHVYVGQEKIHYAKRWHHKMYVTGIPVRKEFYTSGFFEKNSEKITLLIVGGSQSARFWSFLMPAAMALCTPHERKKIHIMHQCLEQDQERLSKAYKEIGCSHAIFHFNNNMHVLLSEATLVFSRAGASMLAEIAVVGKPAFLVPYPHGDGHQIHNATIAEKSAWVYEERNLTPQIIASFIQDIIHNPNLLTQKIQEITPQKGTEKIFSHIQSLLEK